MRPGCFRRAGRLCLAAAIAAAGSAGFAQAATDGGLQLSPIRLDLDARSRGGALTLGNGTARRKTIQVDVMAWSQAGGAEAYEPTRELLANPPLFFLEPGATQVVRVGLPAGSRNDGSRERAYRVYLREVPQESTEQFEGLRVAVRLGVPVFVAPANPAPAPPAWTASLQDDGSLVVTLENRGNVHFRAADLRLFSAAGAELAREAAMHYVLAGSRQSWRLVPKQPLAAGPAKLSALMEDGVREFAVAVTRD